MSDSRERKQGEAVADP